MAEAISKEALQNLTKSVTTMSKRLSNTMKTVKQLGEQFQAVLKAAQQPTGVQPSTSQSSSQRANCTVRGAAQTFRGQPRGFQTPVEQLSCYNYGNIGHWRAECSLLQRSTIGLENEAAIPVGRVAAKVIRRSTKQNGTSNWGGSGGWYTCDKRIISQGHFKFKSQKNQETSIFRNGQIYFSSL